MPIFTKYFCSYKLNKDYTLLINTLTNAIDVVDNKLMDLINKAIKNEEEISKINNEEYDKLKSRGYIFNSLDDEKNLLKTHQKVRNKLLDTLTNIKTWTICPSMECNLSCPYCHEDNTQHESLKRLSIKQLDVILDFILCQKTTNPLILIFGGEPLLKANYELIERILKYGKIHNFPIGITTNGTSLNDEYLNLLSSYKKILSVQVTMDGDKEEHNKKRIFKNGCGTFDVICDNINKFLKMNIPVSIRINIDKNNIDKLENLKNFFNKQGWSQNANFGAYVAPVRIYIEDKVAIDDSEMLDIIMKNKWYSDSFINKLDSSVFDSLFSFFEKSEKNSPAKLWQVTYCEATYGRHYCFAPNGIISTCIRGVGRKDYMIGKFDENCVTIDKEKLNMWKNRSPFEMKNCKDCKFILLCGGGCPKSSIMKHGDINCGVCNDIEKTLEIYVKHNKDKFLRKDI